MTKKQKLIGSIPFLIACGIALFTWFEIMTTEYVATWRHYTALILIIVNAVVYFVWYRPAVLLTGIILALATFKMLSFFTVIQTSYLRIVGITTPEIQLKSLLLLAIYCTINFNLLINWRLDMKEKKAALKKN